MSECGPKQPTRDVRSTSALRGRSGLVLLILSSSGCDSLQTSIVSLGFVRHASMFPRCQSMLSSNFRQELLVLLSRPSIVGPDGVPPGASELEVQTFERLHGLRLPPTVRDWFSVVNGAFCGTQWFVGHSMNSYWRRRTASRGRKMIRSDSSRRLSPGRP